MGQQSERSPLALGSSSSSTKTYTRLPQTAGAQRKLLRGRTQENGELNIPPRLTLCPQQDLRRACFESVRMARVDRVPRTVFSWYQQVPKRTSMLRIITNRHLNTSTGEDQHRSHGNIRREITNTRLNSQSFIASWAGHRTEALRTCGHMES